MVSAPLPATLPPALAWMVRVPAPADVLEYVFAAVRTRFPRPDLLSSPPPLITPLTVNAPPAGLTLKLLRPIRLIGRLSVCALVELSTMSARRRNCAPPTLNEEALAAKVMELKKV